MLAAYCRERLAATAGDRATSLHGCGRRPRGDRAPERLGRRRLGLPAALAWVPVVAGCALIAAGLALMYRTISLFARIGGHACALGPTRRLVVLGPYRHVRNPMITGVLAILLGEAVLLGSAALLVWFGAFFTVNAIWMPLVEEPGLVERFGDDYRRYKGCSALDPRRTPWTGNDI